MTFKERIYRDIQSTFSEEVQIQLEVEIEVSLGKKNDIAAEKVLDEKVYILKIKKHSKPKQDQFFFKNAQTHCNQMTKIQT